MRNQSDTTVVSRLFSKRGKKKRRKKKKLEVNPGYVVGRVELGASEEVACAAPPRCDDNTYFLRLRPRCDQPEVGDIIE